MEKTAVPPQELRLAGTPVRRREYVGYALGMTGYQVQNTLMGMYLVLFLTNILQLPALAVGTMTLLCRFVDACTDIFFGTIGDRTHTRWGSYKPWYVTLAIPASISFAFLFICPGFVTPGSAFALFWAYLVYILYGSVFTTIMYTSYGAFTSVATSEAKERNKLVLSRQFGLNLGNVLASCGMPVLLFCGSGNAPSAPAFRGLAIAVFAASSICYLICGIAVQERVTLNAGQRLPIRKSFQVFKGNWLFLGALLLNVLHSIGIVLFGGLMTYYFIYYKMNPNLMAPAQLVGNFVAIAVNLLLLPRMMRHLTRRVNYVIGVAVFIGCQFAGYLLGAYTISCYLVILGFSVGMIIVYAVTFSIVPDAVDYGEWKNGVAAPGAVNTLLSFVQKSTSGVGTMLVTVILTVVGFDNSLGMGQSLATQQGLRTALFGATSIFFLVSLVGLLFLKTKPEQMQAIRAELKLRRAAEKKEG